MRQILEDAALQSEFLRKGYVTVPFLSPSEVEYVLERLSQLRPDDKFAPENAFTTYHCSFLDKNFEYKRQAHALIQKVFEPHVKKHLSDFRLLNCNFYVKPAKTGEFAVHQNWPAISDLNDTTVTIWCPLQDVVESNGGIQVVEGSHKILPHVEAPNSLPYFDDFRDSVIRDHLEPVPLKAGEAIIFDDSLIHWSARNDSDAPRIAIQALCMPEDASPAFYCKIDDSQFELVHADSEFFLEHGPEDLNARQPHWESLGFIDNPNRPVSESEFAALLRDGEETRRAVYSAPPTSLRPAREQGGETRRGWLDRLRSVRS